MPPFEETRIGNASICHLPPADASLGHAFAALLQDGTVVTWGHAASGGFLVFRVVGEEKGGHCRPYPIVIYVCSYIHPYIHTVMYIYIYYDNTWEISHKLLAF